MSRGNVGQVGRTGWSAEGSQHTAAVSTWAFPLGRGKMWEALEQGDER